MLSVQLPCLLTGSPLMITTQMSMIIILKLAILSIEATHAIMIVPAKACKSQTPVGSLSACS